MRFLRPPIRASLLGLFAGLGVTMLSASLHAQIRFADSTDYSGCHLEPAPTSNVGDGIIVFDYDNDGFDDLYLTGGVLPDKLYRNNHDGTFTDVTLQAKILPHAQQLCTHGGISLDYDKDGLADLYITCEAGGDILLHHNADGTFSDVTKAAGMAWNPSQTNQNMTATVGDFDGDGWPDIYVARWVDKTFVLPDPTLCGAQVYRHTGLANFLWHNQGNGTFINQAKEYGVDDSGTTNIAIFFDYDRDGDLDILTGNDFGFDIRPNHLYKNMLAETGHATFQEVGGKIGFDVGVFDMGIGPCDFNRDGHYDFFSSSIGPEAFLVQDSNGVFHNQALQSGIFMGAIPPNEWTNHITCADTFVNPRTFWDHRTLNLPQLDTVKDPIVWPTLTTTWGSLFFDFDNDGWEDAFIVHGEMPAVTPYFTTRDGDTSQFYYNDHGHFTNITDEVGFKMWENCRGAAVLDTKNDGKMDLVIGANTSGRYRVKHGYNFVKNVTQNSNHWFDLRLKGVTCGSEAIGTNVEFWSKGNMMLRQVNTGGSICSENTLQLHVGLGQATSVDKIVVKWPMDKNQKQSVQTFENVAADRVGMLTQGGDMTFLQTNAVGPTAPTSAVPVSPVAIFPTATADNIHVIGAQQNTRYVVYDLLGRIQMSFAGNGTNETFSVARLVPGRYTLLIQEPKGTTARAFVKN